MRVITVGLISARLKIVKLPIVVFAVGCALAANGAARGQSQSADDPAAKVRVELAAARKLPAALDKTVTPVIDRVWAGFDTKEAIAQVQFMDQYWRLPGNEGFDQSIDRVKARLIQAGFEELPARPRSPLQKPSLWIEPASTPSQGWDQSVGTVAIVRDGQSEQTVISREKERLALSINSFSTAPGGVTAPLIDVGGGGAAGDYTGTDVKGAVVIGTAGASQLFTQAVVNRGAIGVISMAPLPGYLDTNPDILQWGSIPYNETVKGFGFRATQRAGDALKRAAASGSARVRVDVQTSFAHKPERTLSAEIPGAVAPNERIVIAAHVQEPGANDNASGTATNMELARALVVGVNAGRIPKPARTLTFLWVNEISGSRRWLTEHPDDKPGVRYMFSMDMTGEDITKTGGHFLIERWPDPGAVWARPWDPHTEWGAGQVKAESLKGDLINDLHMAICERVAVKSMAAIKRPWDVRSNPYEGGSDHTQFGAAGIPSVLDWHFTDRFYHTNQDTAEKTSPEEMRNVGTAVATTAWLMATAAPADVASVGELVKKVGAARVAIEVRDGATLADNPALVAAWKKWYDEAAQSVERLTVAKPSGGVADHSVQRQQTASSDSQARLALARAIAQSGQWDPALEQLLIDANALVRAEAANAIAQADLGEHKVNRLNLLRAALVGKEQDDEVVMELLDAMLRLPEADAAVAKFVGTYAETTRPVPRILGAIKGLEYWTRKHRGQPLGDQLVHQLRGLATLGRHARIRRLAMQTLQNLSDKETGTIIAAAGDGDFQVRRLATVMLGTLPLAGPDRHEQAAGAFDARLTDPSLHVRIEAVTIAARLAVTTNNCLPIEIALADKDLPVVIQALDTLPAVCPDLVAKAAAFADQLGVAGTQTKWQVALHGLNALARLAPAEAARRIEKRNVQTHSQWQVRAAVATIAGATRNETLLKELSADPTPNVRTSVLAALDAMGSALTYPTAIAALTSQEPQLVREAARRLKGAPKSNETTNALIDSLKRLTDQGKDTSRDPRLAIFARLEEQAPAHLLEVLKRYLDDFDPEIAKASAKLLGDLVPGAEFQPAPKLRRPVQASIEAVQALPRTATVLMADGGKIVLELQVDDAPMAVARFVSLAKSGYYDGLSFHRVVPNFVIQGGSPDANEYSGDSRFMRDQIARVPHLRGSVGISTRGRDTGDAQIFFDLLDLPRLDHDYTVFARTTSGLDVMDHILEGAVILKIIV